ncbi:MAG TPA: tail fiber domain-containing protein [Pyrinomonadaceae bacterium]|jgi:hypothetical protein
MTTVKRFALVLAFALFALVTGARAQTPSVSTVNVTPDGEKVRVAAVGDVLDMRVAVSDEAGDIVFESGPVTGDKLDWTMRSDGGVRVAPGPYTMTVTYRTSSGKLRRRVEQVLVSEAVTTATEKQTSSSPTPATVGTITGAGTTNRVAKFTGANSISDSAIIETGGRLGLGTTSPAQLLHVFGASSRMRLQSTGTGSLTTNEYVTDNRLWQSGAGGSAAANGVASKFFIYDQTAGQFRLVIDPSGNIGVGTVTPTSRLTVNGGIQILGSGNGIKFADGSIQTKAIAGTITGTGTTNRLAKFTGPNSFGNSIITENGGNVGIGTTVPNRPLEIANGRLRMSSSQGDIEFTETADLIALATTSNPSGTLPAFRVDVGTGLTRAFTVLTNGNVGIQNASPERALQIGPDSNAAFTISPSDASPRAGFIRFGDHTGWTLYFARSRESSGGALNTGITGNLMELRDDGRLRLVGFPEGATGTGPLCRTLSNVITICESGSSSLRYKTNVAPYRSGLQVINRLRPITFTRKESGRRGVGLAAEEVKEVEPLLAFDNEKGEAEGVRYELVAVTLINAVKEQQAEIARLRARLARVESAHRSTRRAPRRR